MEEKSEKDESRSPPPRVDPNRYVRLATLPLLLTSERIQHPRGSQNTFTTDWQE